MDKHKDNANKYIVLSLLFILFLIISTILMLEYQKQNKNNKINYSRDGKPTYEVCYKKNDIYDECLGEGMQYISSLIDYININYDYNFKSDQKFDYTYNYRIEAQVSVFDKDNKTKIYDKTYVLLENEEIKTNNIDKFNINRSVKINYEEFNSYIRDLKNNYGILANSDMVVRMYVNTNAKNDKIEKDINTNDVIEITIPLTERQINLTLPSEKLAKTDMIEEINNNNLYLYLFIGSALITLILFVIVIRKIIKVKNKNTYYKEINRINKIYDSLVAEADTSYSKLEEKDFDNVIPIKNIEELVDIALREQKNIIWTEVKHSPKLIVSWYSVIVEKVLYRVIISTEDEKFKKEGK